MSADPAGLPGAASLHAVADELTAPFEGSVRPRTLPWGPLDASTGERTLSLPTGAHHPMVLLRLLSDVDGATTVGATITADVAGAVPGVPLRWGPWTAAGTQLVAAVPAVDAQGTAGALTVAVRCSTIVAGAAPLPRDPDALLVGELVTGVLGKLLLVLTQEKARMRATAREVAAARTLRWARAAALDRHGSDLGAARFRDRLVWDGAARTVTLAPRAEAEADETYRARLRPLRATLVRSPETARAWLTGTAGNRPLPRAPERPSPAPATPGWLADVGITGELVADERQDPLLLGIRLVPDGAARTALLDAVRRTHLVWPGGSAPGDAAHAGRLLHPDVATRQTTARAVLADLGLPADEPVAPALAGALVRLTRLQEALGARPFTALVQGQRDDGGSRFELGLATRLAAPDPGALAAAAAAARSRPDLDPLPDGEDAHGAWLLHAAGLQTAHPLADGTVLTATRALQGLVVDVQDAAVAARLEAPGDPRTSAPVAALTARLTADGATVLPGSALADIRPAASVPALASVVARLDLPQAVDVDDLRVRLAALDPGTWVLADLGAATTTAVTDDLEHLAGLLVRWARTGASSALPLVTAAGTLAVALSAGPLPLAGANIASRHGVAYRWYTRSLRGTAPTLGAQAGPRVPMISPGDGVGVVLCVAHVRTGHNDPYEWRPSLPAGRLLTLEQYEHVMNVVELLTPMGVRADTWSLRRRHVDVDGSGLPTPLPPSAARTYRRYRTR